jgi:hypothetical protein
LSAKETKGKRTCLSFSLALLSVILLSLFPFSSISFILLL